MDTINVQNIMEEIRKDIIKKGYKNEELEFADRETVIKAGGSFTYEGLNRVVGEANNHYSVQWYQQLSGRGIILKKIIRKLSSFLVGPIVESQNGFNAATVKSLNLIAEYINANKNLQEENAILKERVQNLEDELLKSRILINENKGTEV